MTFTAETTADEVASQLSGYIAGKTVLITGTSPNSLGAAAAHAIAAHSPKLLILASRDLSKVTTVIDDIHKKYPSSTSIAIHALPLDLASLTSVRAAATQILALTPRLDVLIANAGVMATPTYQTTEQGVELQFGVNFLGHFALANLLQPALAVARGRVVVVTSAGHRQGGVRFDDWNFEEGKAYDKWAAYAQSKTADILLAVSLSRRGVLAYAVDPGVIVTTSLTRSIPFEEFRALGWVDEHGNLNTKDFTPKSAGQGAAGMLVAGFDPALAGQSGSVLVDAQVDAQGAEAYAVDAANAERLWGLGEKLAGEEFVW